MIILTKKKYKKLVKDIQASFELTIKARTKELEERIQKVEYSLLENGNEKIIEKKKEGKKKCLKKIKK